MKIISNLLSYIFHPIFIPIEGTLAYLIITSINYGSSTEIQTTSILPIFILTVVIPIISFLILRNIGVVKTVFLEQISERKYPLYIYTIILLLVVYKIIPHTPMIELYYHFIGLIIAAFTALVVVLLKFKVSLHAMGTGGLLTYLINLSIHYQINLITIIAIGILLTGGVITARLYLKAHTKPEVIIGLIIGIVSQLITVGYWL